MVRDDKYEDAGEAPVQINLINVRIIGEVLHGVAYLIDRVTKIVHKFKNYKSTVGGVSFNDYQRRKTSLTARY